MKGTTIVTYKGIEVEVDYDFTPGRPGVWTLPNGDPGYPDDPDELDVEAIKIGGVDIYDILSQESINLIDELTFNKVRNS